MKDMLQIFTNKNPQLRNTSSGRTRPEMTPYVCGCFPLTLGGRDCFMSDLKWKTTNQTRRRAGEELLDRADTEVVSRSAGIKMPLGKKRC